MSAQLLASQAEPAGPDDVSQEDRSRYWFSRHSKSIIFLILALVFVGIYEAFTIPIAVFPATNFPRIIVSIDNGVMPIDQMEVTITRPVEEAVNAVPGLTDVRSITSRGSAEVDLSFKWTADMAQTLLQVNAAIDGVRSNLPSTVQIEAHRLDFASFPIFGFSLTSDSVLQSKLWEAATYDLKPRLNRLDGVASVLVQGGQVPEFQITPDPARMLRSRVSVQDILDAVNHSNLIDSPGLVTQEHQLFLGLLTAQAQTADDLGSIVIKSVNDVPVRIEDVGSVSNSAAPAYTVVTANGKPAVLVSINRQPDSNTVAVANEVNAELDALRSSLPPGVKLSVFYDQSNLVRDSVGSVRDAILIGLFLTGLIIWLFLRDIGTALLAGLVVPVTIALTFVGLKLFGQSFNMMTLGGLAAAGGLVIDDAIVIVENIVLHRDSGEPPLRATQNALRELTVPLIGSTLTPIVVFLPLISITGVTGTFFRALAVTMSISLLTSLALALGWTTNLGSYWIRRGESVPPPEFAAEKKELPLLQAEHAVPDRGIFGRVLHFYDRCLRFALHRPIWIAVFCALLIVVSYACYNFVGTDLLPSLDEGGFILDYVMPPGSSLEETNRVLDHVESILHATPEVESTSRRTGMQLGLAAVTEPNTGDIAVKLKSNRARGMDDIISDVRSKVTKQEPVLDVDFHQVLEDMIGDLTGAPQPVVIKLFSPDATLLASWAPKVADAIGKITVGGAKPVVDIQDGIEATTSGPAVLFNINPQAAARAGFTPDQLTVAASAIVDGEPATTPVVVNDRPYTVRVRFPEANRASVDAISNTVLVNSSGGSATLGALADIQKTPGQTEILRDNLQRDVEVTARLEGLDLGSGVAAVQQAVRDLKLPPSIRVEYGGTYKEQQQSFRDLAVVLLLALVLIFLVLLVEFRTFTAPIAILTSAIFSLSGVFLALLITRTTFNVSSFMGLIMVIGIVAKNGILLLDANQRFRAAGLSREEALLQAGRRRMRPIAMTAMAAVAGMLPLSLALGSGSQMLQPLAIAVIGGILISMASSLLVTPAMEYYLTRD